jgi:threonine/homoserine/homoserine lactone efflux protein
MGLGQAIGQTLPLAVAVGISPIPIIAVILMLTSKRARANGPAFLIGWIAGIGIVGALVLLVIKPLRANVEGEPATWVNVVQLVLGLFLVLLAVRQWRGRGETSEPAWMDAVDDFSPAKALSTGLVLAAVNPKNFLLSVAAAETIAGTGISGTDETIAYAVFALVATIGVAAPVAIYFLMGDRAGPLLGAVRTWMARNNAVIMAVLFVVIGAKLIGDAIGGLSS